MRQVNCEISLGIPDSRSLRSSFADRRFPAMRMKFGSFAQKTDNGRLFIVNGNTVLPPVAHTGGLAQSILASLARSRLSHSTARSTSTKPARVKFMNRQPFEKPPRWWSPKPSPRWISIWRPLRMHEQRKKHRLVDVKVHGAQRIQELLREGQGVLITPNHCSHADAFALYSAADRAATPIYAMMAWQVFARGSWLRAQILRQHGAFSIDREGTDLAALRKAREVLERDPYPLAIFPEGEVYHLNERITPFREGPAAIALMAARKASRSISCVPCAIRYHYVQDPTPELSEVMDRLEQSLHWRPRHDLSLRERIYHLAEGALALKEVEILGKTQSGPLVERIHKLIEFILGRVECGNGLSANGKSIPERVKEARRTLIARLETLPEDESNRHCVLEDLDDLFLVVQAYSYPGDYVSEKPSIERIAETVDKFEEDLLGVKTATIRGSRRAEVYFGEPIPVPSSKKEGVTPTSLTQSLQEGVEKLLGLSETPV